VRDQGPCAISSQDPRKCADTIPVDPGDMNTPNRLGAVLDPDTLGDDFIAMKWRPVPRARSHGASRRDDRKDFSEPEARWPRRLSRRPARGGDELNETFLCFTNHTGGPSLGDY